MLPAIICMLATGNYEVRARDSSKIPRRVTPSGSYHLAASSVRTQTHPYLVSERSATHSAWLLPRRRALGSDQNPPIARFGMRGDPLRPAPTSSPRTPSAPRPAHSSSRSARRRGPTCRVVGAERWGGEMSNNALARILLRRSMP